jgi:hypothetical protein
MGDFAKGFGLYSKSKRKGQMWFYTPVIPATREAEMGASWFKVTLLSPSHYFHLPSWSSLTISFLSFFPPEILGLLAPKI